MPVCTTYDYGNPADRVRAQADVELALSEFEDDNPRPSHATSPSGIPRPTSFNPSQKFGRGREPPRPRTATSGSLFGDLEWR